MSTKNYNFLFFILLFLFMYSHQYSITYINELKANYIVPIINNFDDCLYIVTGETTDIPNNFNPGDAKFKRFIIKISINSGILLSNYTYMSVYPFLNSEITFAGDNLQYLLTTTLNSIEFDDGKKRKEISFSSFGYKRTLKQVGSYYYYAYNTPDYLNSIIILKMQLSLNSGNESYTIIKTSNYIPVHFHSSVISCDFTKDNNYILCAYFGDNRYVRISIFNNDLDFIKMQDFEEVIDLQYDYFIRIIYFKENSHFIVINSQSQSITRFRYINYVNNNLISLIYSIVANGDYYIDVEDTQFDPGENNNDAIAMNSDKVIKIYTGDSQIIITIFQFYEHGTLLFIKTYKMSNFYDSGFTQPRLSVFRNTFLICLSANVLSQQTTGYFFINYPQSVDTHLTKDNNIIKISELISMENNLFLLKLKLKLLKIPKDFIFINLLELKEVNETKELDFNDALKLKQYRIDEGPYILKYQGIAIGDDSGYSSSKVYPSYKDKPEASNVYIEGREGNVTIELNECLDGYYHLDYDSNICTNEKPKGYYVDEENKYFRACQSPCVECFGPKINDSHMNCLTCEEGLYITEDTKSCFRGKENYFIDTDKKVLRRCHPRCSKCFIDSINDHNMCCLECIKDKTKNYFFKEDTHNCILSSEFPKREFIVLTAVSSYSYVIFIIILAISTLISLYIFYFSCKGLENRILNETRIEMKYYEYKLNKSQSKKEEKEEKEQSILEKSKIIN